MNKVCDTVKSNSLLILFLGACPAMGATASLLGALGMGVAVLAVMLLSAIVIALLGKLIPSYAKIPAYILIITGFVSLIQMLMNAFLPEIYAMLGIYITVAAVDLLIFGTAEKAECGIGCAIASALKNGILFIIALAVTGAVREVFGSAAIAGTELSFLSEYRIPILTMAPGGFIVYSFVAAIASKLSGSPKLFGKGVAAAASGVACCCEEKKEEAVQ